MYVPLDEILQQYDIIRRDSISHTTCKLAIFVSCLNIDALCASKMLSQLLKADLIPHKIVPIAGFDEMRDAYAAIQDDLEISTVVLVGCGATIDVLSYLQVDRETVNKKFYIIDNHRPWNLENLFATDKIMCLYDEDTDDDSYVEKLKDAYINLLKLYEEQDKNESDSENEDQDDDDPTDEENDIEELHKEDDDDIPPRKRHIDRLREARKTEARIGRYEHTLETHYTKGTYVSTSITAVVYELFNKLGKTTIPSLWLAVVGSTSLDFQHPHIYQIIYPVLRTEVLRLNPRSVHIDTNAMRSASIDLSPEDAPITPTSLTGDDDSLYPEPDYLFFLLRHWSLYESMAHSSYISAKLRLYTEDGRRRMKTILASMGISLHDARESWVHTNVAVKKTLLQKLSKVATAYNIKDVIREGIVRRFGFKGSLSAGDCVDALITLLQVGHLVNAENCRTVPLLMDSNAATEAADLENGESVEEAESRERFWVANFWNAWDAMDKVDKLMEGIEKAKQIQQNIVVAATELFEKRRIKNLQSYRLAVIRDGPDLELFSNPLALTRLAQWISDACAEVTQQPLPLVVASYYKPTDTYLVLGMAPQRSREENEQESELRGKRKNKARRPKKKKKRGAKADENGRKAKRRKSSDEEEEEDDEESGEDEDDEQSDDEKEATDEEEEDEDDQEEDEFNRYNAFGTAFYKVAEQINARVKLDSFESAVIEVSREELSRFLEALAGFDLLRRRRRPR